MKNGEWSQNPKLIGFWSQDGLAAGSVAKSSAFAGKEDWESAQPGDSEPVDKN